MPIKPGYVKDLAEELMEKYPSAFGHDFEHNKSVVSKLTNVESKSVRNKIAGFITRRNRPQKD